MLRYRAFPTVLNQAMINSVCLPCVTIDLPLQISGRSCFLDLLALSRRLRTPDTLIRPPKVTDDYTFDSFACVGKNHTGGSIQRNIWQLKCPRATYWCSNQEKSLLASIHTLNNHGSRTINVTVRLWVFLSSISNHHSCRAAGTDLVGHGATQIAPESTRI